MFKRYPIIPTTEKYTFFNTLKNAHNVKVMQTLKINKSKSIQIV